MTLRSAGAMQSFSVTAPKHAHRPGGIGIPQRDTLRSVGADYRLQALLELREHALAAAEQSLAHAAASLARLEAAQTALDHRVEVLLQKLARFKQAEPSTRKAAQLQADAHFETRLREELTHAQHAAHAHRAGALASVLRRLSEAQTQHLQAKQDLKLVTRHREAAQSEALRQGERRQEDETDAWLHARRS